MNISFEFFPPKTEAQRATLSETRQQLVPLGPEYFSVTFGAGGSTLDHTAETVSDIHHHDGVPVAPHLSCIGGRPDSIRKLILDYQAQGIDRIVALRGDLPSGMASLGEFRHANELVAFIRAETGDHFHIAVAAYPEVHPEAETAAIDLRHFKRKVEAGADSAITQYFFNADAYHFFVDRCQAEGIDIPIIPGIMPITNYSQLSRFSEMCGAEMPRWLRRRLQDFGDDRASIAAFGTEVISRMCEQLIADGVPGLHFYTLNQHKPSLAILRNLGLAPE